MELLETLHPEIVVNTHHHEDHTGKQLFQLEKKIIWAPPTLQPHPKNIFLFTKSFLNGLTMVSTVGLGCPHSSETANLNSKVQTNNIFFFW